MTTLRFLFAALILCFGLSTTAEAQAIPPTQGLVGDWEITNTDGTPPVPGKTAGFEVVQIGPNVFVGFTYLEDETGKLYISSEVLTIVGGPYNYAWANPKKETTGTITFDTGSGGYKVSGPSGDRILTAK